MSVRLKVPHGEALSLNSDDKPYIIFNYPSVKFYSAEDGPRGTLTSSDKAFIWYNSDGTEIMSLTDGGALAYTSTGVGDITTSTGVISSSVAATGGADVAFQMKSAASYGAADTLVSFKVNTSEVASISGTGAISGAGITSSTGVITSSVAASGGADVAFQLKSAASYGAADTHTSFKVDSAEVASISGSGALSCAGITSSTGVVTSGVAATGGADVAFTLKSAASYGAADTHTSFKVDSTEVASISGTGVVSIGTTIQDSDGTIEVKGNMADGAAAVAVESDSGIALATLGAKALSVRNNNVEKLFVDKDGGLGQPAYGTSGDVPCGTLTIASGNTSGSYVGTTSNYYKNVKVMAMINNTTSNAVSVLRAVSDNDKTIAITLSGDPGASGADVFFFVVRTATPG